MTEIVTIGSTQSSDAVPAQPAASGGLEVTPSAVKRIRVILAKEGISLEEGGLRLGVKGGGCSGMSYSVGFDVHHARQTTSSPLKTFESLSIPRASSICRA